jgi:hypothetical protein
MVKRHLKAIHDLARAHRALVEASKTCGCFYCRKTFPASEIREWVDKAPGSGGSTTALCPRCGIDSVLPGGLIKLSKAMLDEMNDYWFGTHRSIPAERVRAEISLKESALKKLSEDERRALGLRDPEEWEEY